MNTRPTSSAVDSAEKNNTGVAALKRETMIAIAVIPGKPNSIH